MTSKNRYSRDTMKGVVRSALGTKGDSDTTKEQKYIIGTVIYNENSRAELFNILRKPSMFTSEKNRTIWSVLLEMHRLGKDVELIALKRNLSKEEGDFDLSLYDEYETANNMETARVYAEYIYADYCVHRVRINAKKIYANLDSVKPDEIRNFLHNQMVVIEDLSKLLPNSSKSVEKIMEGAESMIHNPKGVIEFPLRKLNLAAGGATRGHTTIIGARTGHGKTTLLVNLVDGWLKAGYKIRWYSREQSSEEMMQACIVINSGIDRMRIRKKQLTPDDKKKIKSAIASMKHAYSNLVIRDDIDNMEDTITDIVSAEEKPDIIIDDFLQLINVKSQRSGRRFEIEDILKGYHWLQKRYNFITVAASQLSRQVEQRQFDNEPRLSDLAESSVIEQLAENVILLWYEYKFLGTKSEYSREQIKAIFGKTRFGNTGHKVLEMNLKTGGLS